MHCSQADLWQGWSLDLHLAADHQVLHSDHHLLHSDHHLLHNDHLHHHDHLLYHKEQIFLQSISRSISINLNMNSTGLVDRLDGWNESFRTQTKCNSKYFIIMVSILESCYITILIIIIGKRWNINWIVKDTRIDYNFQLLKCSRNLNLTKICMSYLISNTKEHGCLKCSIKLESSPIIF